MPFQLKKIYLTLFIVSLIFTISFCELPNEKNNMGLCGSILNENEISGNDGCGLAPCILTAGQYNDLGLNITQGCKFTIIGYLEPKSYDYFKFNTMNSDLIRVTITWDDATRNALNAWIGDSINNKIYFNGAVPYGSTTNLEYESFVYTVDLHNTDRFLVIDSGSCYDDLLNNPPTFEGCGTSPGSNNTWLDPEDTQGNVNYTITIEGL